MAIIFFSIEAYIRLSVNEREEFLSEVRRLCQENHSLVAYIPEPEQCATDISESAFQSASDHLINHWVNVIQDEPFTSDEPSDETQNPLRAQIKKMRWLLSINQISLSSHTLYSFEEIENNKIGVRIFDLSPNAEKLASSEKKYSTLNNAMQNIDSTFWHRHQTVRNAILNAFLFFILGALLPIPAPAGFSPEIFALIVGGITAGTFLALRLFISLLICCYRTCCDSPTVYAALPSHDKNGKDDNVEMQPPSPEDEFRAAWKIVTRSKIISTTSFVEVQGVDIYFNVLFDAFLRRYADTERRDPIILLKTILEDQKKDDQQKMIAICALCDMPITTLTNKSDHNRPQNATIRIAREKFQIAWERIGCTSYYEIDTQEYYERLFKGFFSKYMDAKIQDPVSAINNIANLDKNPRFKFEQLCWYCGEIDIIFSVDFKDHCKGGRTLTSSSSPSSSDSSSSPPSLTS